MTYTDRKQNKDSSNNDLKWQTTQKKQLKIFINKQTTGFSGIQTKTYSKANNKNKLHESHINS